MRTNFSILGRSRVPQSLVALAGLFTISCAPAADSTAVEQAAQAAAPTPPPATGFQVAPGLPPLPTAGLAAAPRSVETVRAVYGFAASHPEVLDYVPCFCGCESAGHKSNTHCFVGARNSEGTVTQWDYHGLT